MISIVQLYSMNYATLTGAVDTNFLPFRGSTSVLLAMAMAAHDRVAEARPAQEARLWRAEARVELATLRQRRAAALYDAADEHEREPLAAADANALGCCCRRRGELESALDILYQGISSAKADVLSAGSIHLNLGAALAAIGRHQDALDQANAAVIVLQEELFNSVNIPMEEQLAEGVQLLASGLQIDGTLRPAQVAAEAARQLMEAESDHFEERALHLIHLRKHDEAREVRREQKQARDRQRAAVASSPTLLVEIQRLCKVFGLQLSKATETPAEIEELEESLLTSKVALLAAAYHNAGVEQEALRKYDLAVQSYIDATNLSRTHLGRDSNITLMLAASRDAAARENPKAQNAKRLAAEVKRELRAIFKSHRMQLIDAFKRLDTNNDGVIDEGEMRKGLARLNIGLSAQQVEDLLAVIDRDGNGLVDYSEFAKQFGDTPRPGEKDLAGEMTARWSECPAEIQVDRIEAGQILATEAALIAGRWAAPSVIPESMGSWPPGLTTVLQPPSPIRLLPRSLELAGPMSESESLADIDKMAKSAKPKLDWSEAALSNILNFDASLALPHKHAQERARQKAALMMAEHSLAADRQNCQTNQSSGAGGASVLELPEQVLHASGGQGLGESKQRQQEEHEKQRLARQHAAVCAPWKNRKSWQGAAKKEMRDRKAKLEQQAAIDRHCFNALGVRNTAKSSPYIQRIEEISKAGSFNAYVEQDAAQKKQPEQVQEHHVSQAFALMNLVRGALDKARKSGGAMAEDAEQGPGLAAAVSPAVLFRAIDEVSLQLPVHNSPSCSLTNRSAMFGQDGSGQLDEDELLDAFTRLGLSLQRPAVRQIISFCDADGNGRVDYREFMLLLGGKETDVADPEVC